MYTDHMFQNKENKSVPGVFSGSSLVSGTANLLWKAFQSREPRSARRRTACAEVGSRENAQELRAICTDAGFSSRHRLALSEVRA